MDDKMALSRMLFSELYKIMVNKVSFLGFRGRDRPICPLDPPLIAWSVALKTCISSNST